VDVRANWTGDVRVEVSQTALVAVADAFVIEVLDEAGNVVFTAATPDNPLVADVAGLGVLGVTGDNTLVTTATGLPPGNYRVVVRNDQSALETLLDQNGDGNVSLTELGDEGVVLGPDNQDAVLTAVENALNGEILAGIGLRLGTAVRKLILEPLLAVGATIGAADLVNILTEGLNTLGLSMLVNGVLDAVAAALLSNTLTLLQRTEVTTTLTEYDFAGATEFSGNVIGGSQAGVGDVADSLAEGGVVTEVTGSDGVAVTVLGTDTAGVTVYGEYGKLTIYENGNYDYVLTNPRGGVGKTETFSYTISDGFTLDTATLVINIDGDGAADDAVVAGVVFVNTVESLPASEYGSFETGPGLIIPSTGSETVTLSVAENTQSDATIYVLLGGGVTLLPTFSITVTKVGETQPISEQTLISVANIGGLGVGGVSIALPDLASGEYTVTVSSTNILSTGYTSSIQIAQDITYLNQYEVDTIQSASGNLFANDVAYEGAYSLQVTKDGSIYVTADADGEQVVGTYGTLLVRSDGSYTYTPFNTLTDPDASLAETFDYRVVHADLSESVSSLTVYIANSGNFQVADGTQLTLTSLIGSTNIDSITMADGAAQSSITMIASDVISVSDTDTLSVYGDANDQVNLAGATQGGVVSDANNVSLTQYSWGPTTVLVENDIVSAGGVII
jgi:large repetitive protein